MTAPPLQASSATTARIDGREMVVFGGCDYLGLAHHPAVLGAARGAIGRFGLSASASRETTGNASVHAELESRMASFCGLEAGLLVPDGYIANLAAAQGLFARGFRHAVIDARAHASLADAARLSGLRATVYPHLDAARAGEALARCDGPAAVLTDSVFAADGARAPLEALRGCLRDDDALLIDDCHGLCVLGDRGRGAASAGGLADHRLVVTTTLAKGFGCGGGMVMGSVDVVSSLRQASTAYICTTPVSPVLAAAGLAVLGVLGQEAGLLDSLRRNAGHMAGLLRRAGLGEHDGVIPIFAFTGSDDRHMRALFDSAWSRGIWMPLVSYPGGPGARYFRLSVNAAHSPDQIDALGEVLGSHARGPERMTR